MGSKIEDISAAVAMDKDGAQFPLLNETPQFTAMVPDFYMGVYNVTNFQFALFLSRRRPSIEQLQLWLPWMERIVPPVGLNDVYHPLGGYENHPVTNVSWFGAEAYCRWAGVRLPSEIEWEKAARGDDARIFPWGNEWEPENLSWWGSHDATHTTTPVDDFACGLSPYGIYQMAGNVEEWCADWFQDDIYHRYATGDLKPPGHGMGRILRGGNCLRKNKLEFRCSMRRAGAGAFTNVLLTGIRCACDA